MGGRWPTLASKRRKLGRHNRKCVDCRRRFKPRKKHSLKSPLEFNPLGFYPDSKSIPGCAQNFLDHLFGAGSPDSISIQLGLSKRNFSDFQLLRRFSDRCLAKGIQDFCGPPCLGKAHCPLEKNGKRHRKLGFFVPARPFWRSGFLLNDRGGVIKFILGLRSAIGPPRTKKEGSPPIFFSVGGSPLELCFSL